VLHLQFFDCVRVSDDVEVVHTHPSLSCSSSNPEYQDAKPVSKKPFMLFASVSSLSLVSGCTLGLSLLRFETLLLAGLLLCVVRCCCWAAAERAPRC
jgi:hypothetical protein